MRTKGLTLALVLMTIGLAILGWVNPTLGVVFLFGGAALWIVCQKKTLTVLERVIASESRRQALDEKSAKKQHAREQFFALSAAEKEAVKYVKLNGHILPQQVASHLASRGFPEADGIIGKVRSKTPFLLGSFSGEFSINPELKEPLDELLNPPLLNPTVRGVALAAAVIVVIGCGLLFHKYVYPGDARTSTLVEPGTGTSSSIPSAIRTQTDNRFASQNVTAQQGASTQGAQDTTPAQPIVNKPAKRTENPAAKHAPTQQTNHGNFSSTPQQDISPHLEAGKGGDATGGGNGGAGGSISITAGSGGNASSSGNGGAGGDVVIGPKILQQSSGDCSPNIVGGGNNVNCGPPRLEMKWSAKSVDPPQLTEDKRAFKYQQQVKIEVNQPYTPVSVGVVCSAEIGEIQGFLPGGSAQFFPKHGTDKDNKKMGFVYFEGSPATPTNPLVISIWSDQPLSVLRVDKAVLNTN